MIADDEFAGDVADNTNGSELGRAEPLDRLEARGGTGLGVSIPPAPFMVLCRSEAASWNTVG